MIDLSIVLITYNRADYLRKTLDSLANSFCKDTEIIILNNCSTDSTLDVCESYKNHFSNFTIVTHSLNIGGNANILRAYEYGSRYYKWILCDDDYLKFEHCDDLVSELNAKKNDILIVTDVGVGIQQYSTTKPLGELLCSQNSETFWTMGFVPAVIFKNNVIRHQIVKGYENLYTYYQQLFVLLATFNKDTMVYTLSKPILERGPAPTGIGCEILLKWVLSFRALPDSATRKRAEQIVFGRHKNESLFCYLTRFSLFFGRDLTKKRSRKQIIQIIAETVFRCPSFVGKVLLMVNSLVLLIPTEIIKKFKKKSSVLQ